MEIRENTLHINQHKGKAASSETIQFQKTSIRERSGWATEPFTFLGEKAQRADGCRFTIKPPETPESPYNSIWVVRCLQDVSFQEALTKGSGYWLAQSPKGEVIVIESNPDEQGAVIEWGGKGWVNTWIAKDLGAEIIDITEPPYTFNTEQELPIDDPSVSSAFWSEYHKLKRDTLL